MVFQQIDSLLSPLIIFAWKHKRTLHSNLYLFVDATTGFQKFTTVCSFLWQKPNSKLMFSIYNFNVLQTLGSCTYSSSLVILHTSHLHTKLCVLWSSLTPWTPDHGHGLTHKQKPYGRNFTCPFFFTRIRVCYCPYLWYPRSFGIKQWTHPCPWLGRNNSFFMDTGS